MRSLLLLTSLVPFVIGECPAILVGLPTKMERVDNFDEALDTACGRRNYTSLFWSEHFRDQMIVSVSSQFLFDELPKQVNDKRPFTPLIRSFSEQFKAMDNEEAKAYVDAFVKNQRKFATGLFSSIHPENQTEATEPSPPRFFLGFFQKIIQEISDVFEIKTTHRLSVAAQLALTQALKAGMSFEETNEMKRERIDVAMKALDRVDIDKDEDRVALMFAQMYLLAKEISAKKHTFSKEKTSFEEFAEWMEHEWSVEGVSQLEITPALETLYLQYRTLNNTEAKEFVYWVLSTQTFLSLHKFYDGEEDMPEVLQIVGETLREDQARDIYRRCPTKSAVQCYSDLKEDAQAALVNAFPELAIYLSNNDWFARRMAKLRDRTIEEAYVAPKKTPKPHPRMITKKPKY